MKKNIILLSLVIFLLSYDVAPAQEISNEQKQELIQAWKKIGASDEKIEEIFKTKSDEEIYQSYNDLKKLQEQMKALQNGSIEKQIQDDLDKQREANRKEQLAKQEREIKITNDYLPFLEVETLNVRYFIDYNDNKNAGVENIKIKNRGDKTIKRIELVFYFKDENNIVIYEDSLNLLDGYDGKPLKPNYIYQQESNRYYKFDNVPTGWQEGNIEYKIVDIRFE